MPSFSTTMVAKTARCACGGVSIVVAGEPEIYNICHCTNCKQRTGSAFGISCYFKQDKVTNQIGSTSVYAFHHINQNHNQNRHFCPACGTTLFWYVSDLPDLIGVAGGCFGELNIGTPNMSLTHAKKLPWVELPTSCRLINQ
jgi:hypothetical protein